MSNLNPKWAWHTEGNRAFIVDEQGFTVCEVVAPADNNLADIAKSIVDDHNKAMNPPAQQPEAQAVARLVIVDRGGGFKAIRTWDDIGDLPPGEHFLFSADSLHGKDVGGEDWKARALAAEADIERMTDAFNRENGPTFMGEPVLPPEKMVELEPGVSVPTWLLDHARRIELYMKSKLPGPWRIGGIQSHDYAIPDQPGEKVRGLVTFPISVTEEMMVALRRFNETAEDDESYDVPKEMMSRLAMFGLVTRGRPGWYYLTDFGRAALSAKGENEDTTHER